MSIKFGSGYPLHASSATIVTMVAKFSSVCKCGALIEPGDAMSYDTLNRKSLCYVCVKRLSDFGAPDVSNKSAMKGSNNVAKSAASSVNHDDADNATKNATKNEANPEAKCQRLIQKFRELRAETQITREQRKQEMIEILKCFKTEFTSSASVHTFIAEIAKCKHRGADCRALKTKFHGACIHCGAVNEAGELALYDHHARRIHCLYCDCLRGM
jgi:hypothetical protein